MFRFAVVLFLALLFPPVHAGSALIYENVLPYGFMQHQQGTLTLEPGKVPINTRVISALRACVSNPLAYPLPTVRLDAECVNEFANYGFAVLFTRHMAHRMSGYIATTYMAGLQFGYSNLQLNYNAASNTINYAFDYSVSDSWCGSDSYSAGSPCGAISIGIVAMEMSDTDIYAAYNGEKNAVEVTLSKSNWVDLHLTVNNRGVLNYRMQKNGMEYSHPLLNTVKNGDQLDFSLTWQHSSGLAYDSRMYSIKVSGLAPDFRDSYSEGVFIAHPRRKAEWVDVHYSIDGGQQYNRRMLDMGDNTFECEAVQANGLTAQSGQAIDYFFTYMVDGVAYDTEFKTIKSEQNN